MAYRNRLYAIGGYDGKKKKKSVEVYDPEENRCGMVETKLLFRVFFKYSKSILKASLEYSQRTLRIF